MRFEVPEEDPIEEDPIEKEPRAEVVEEVEVAERAELGDGCTTSKLTLAAIILE